MCEVRLLHFQRSCLITVGAFPLMLLPRQREESRQQPTCPVTDGNPPPVWKTRRPFINKSGSGDLLLSCSSEALKLFFSLHFSRFLFHTPLYLAELKWYQLNMLFHMLHYWTCSSIIHSFPHESPGNCASESNTEMKSNVNI